MQGAGFDLLTIDAADAPGAIYAHLKTLRDRASIKREKQMMGYWAYEANPSLISFAELYDVKLEKDFGLKLNVYKNAIDTMTSKLGKQRVRVSFVPTNGSYEAREKSKLLTQALDGLFDMIGYHEVKRQTFRDALICGTGVTKVFFDQATGLVRAERVFPLELFVDELDALYGNPSFVYQVKILPRKTVSETFGVPEEDLTQAETWAFDLLTRAHSSKRLTSYSMRNTCVVVECYHRSLSDEKKGRHLIVTSNKVLLDEEWPFEFLPYTFERFTDVSLGFWGNGVWDDAGSIQVEIDRVARRIQESIEVGSSFKVFIEEGSEVKKQNVTNKIGQVITFRGQPPIFSAPQTVSSDVYAYLNQLIERFYSVIGVSQLSAQSQKPAGLNAAIALREYQDIESERFQVLSQRREESVVTDAKRILKIYSIASEHAKRVTIPVTNRLGAVRKLKASDLLTKDEEFIIRAFPTSLLPTTPQARLQMVTELFQGGLIKPEEFWDLLDVPDTERLFSRYTSSTKLVHKQLEEMMRTKTYIAPDPYVRVDDAIKVATMFYLDAKGQEYDEERLELIRQFITHLQSYSQEVQATEQMIAQAQQLQQAMASGQLVPAGQQSMLPQV